MVHVVESRFGGSVALLEHGNKAREITLYEVKQMLGEALFERSYEAYLKNNLTGFESPIYSDVLYLRGTMGRYNAYVDLHPNGDVVANCDCGFCRDSFCVHTGALLINTMISAGGYNYGPANRPVIMQTLDGMEPVSEVDAGTEEERRQMADAVASYTAESKRIVETAVAANEVVLTGPRELVTVNIYNARFYNGYLTSTYFLMYLENGERKMIQGNFVIRMKDEKTIDTVYRWK